MDCGGTDKPLSSTFGNAMQDRLIVDGLLWLGGAHKRPRVVARTPESLVS